MTGHERALVVVLRAAGVLTLTALGAAIMPFSWMAATHRFIGLGELPDTVIVGYLTRSLSAMYAIHGALLLYLSFDVRRYLGLVRFLAVIGLVFGGGLIVLDLAVGLPLAWTLCEGPFVIGLSIVLYWLAGRVE